MSEKFTVRVGAGICEVIQLDDPGMTWDDRPIEVKWKSHKSRHVDITADEKQFKSILSACDSRCMGGWDQPPWYVASAKACAKRLRAALKARGEA